MTRWKVQIIDYDYQVVKMLRVIEGDNAVDRQWESVSFTVIYAFTQLISWLFNLLGICKV